jgi:hypothetical protein
MWLGSPPPHYTQRARCQPHGAPDFRSSRTPSRERDQGSPANGLASFVRAESESPGSTIPTNSSVACLARRLCTAPPRPTLLYRK